MVTTVDETLPPAETFLLQHRPNLRRIEIEITTRCNLMCRHCDRRCSQARANVDMDLSIIDRFIAESRELGLQWEKICILGGEPTLHPDLATIIARLSDYAAEQGHCELFMVSNACGKGVNRRLDLVRGSIAIEERPKTAAEPWFKNMDLAPVDRGVGATTCAITQVCGLGLTSWGYFPCGAGAAIARALDLDIGIASLHEVTEERMIGLLSRLCQVCGHAAPVQAEKDNSVSPFWERATAAYTLRHPVRQAARNARAGHSQDRG